MTTLAEAQRITDCKPRSRSSYPYEILVEESRGRGLHWSSDTCFQTALGYIYNRGLIEDFRRFVANRAGTELHDSREVSA